MAGLSREKGRNSWKLTWYEGTQRKSIRLGEMPKKMAESFKLKFEQLQACHRAGDSHPSSISEWLGAMSPDLRERIAKAGLIESKRLLCLEEFCAEFLASRADVARNTMVRDRQVVALLLEKFGGKKRIDSITVRDAEEWQRWLAKSGNKRDSDRTTLSENTVRRRTGVASQIFNTAIRWNLLKKNPFELLPKSVRENVERRKFITWVDILKVIEIAPTTEWKTLIAFVRLTGCRVPSELVDLKWSDIDLDAKRICIRSPKTKHHGGDHALRFVPLFPELLPYLQALSDEIEPGISTPFSASVFPIAADERPNLRTQFTRMIEKAGLVPWEKLFVNLRSSRESELLAEFPATDVCKWFGHSPAVAAKFYAQSRPEIAERATKQTTVAVGTNAGDSKCEKGTKTGPVTNHQRSSTELRAVEKATEIAGNSKDADGPSDAVDGNENGRYRTRTCDLCRVKAAL